MCFCLHIAGLLTHKSSAMKISSKKLLAFVFAVMLIITVVIGVFSYNNNKTFEETSHWLRRSYIILDKTDDIYSLAMQIENGSNKYAYTHDSNSIVLYNSAKSQIGEALDTLKILTRNRPIQNARIDTLKTIINMMVNDTQKSMSRVNYAGLDDDDDDKEVLFIRGNRQYNDKINILLSEILGRENMLLREREAANNRSIAVFHWVFYSLLACLFALLVTVISLILHIFKRQNREKTITEKALTREKELNEMKSRFVSFASHEFRTPLATILSSTALIERYQEPSLDKMSIKHIARIKSNVSSLIDLLNDFLSLGKLEEGKIEYNPAETDIAEFSDELILAMQEMTKEGQKIHTEISGPAKLLYVDERLLKNILNNLLSNAIKYSLEGGDIYYRVKFNQESVVFEVEDHGIGIPEKDQKHLFETFFRASNATQTPGTGLGLCIVRRYLQILGGTLQFTSKENEGTRFVITIPKRKQGMVRI